MNCRSPNTVNSNLQVIVNHLGLDEREAILLKYRKPVGFDPEIDNCYFNCWVAARGQNGAMVQHGWVLTQDVSNAFSEAIFHAVLKQRDGSLIDVTPRVDGEKRLMFIPDPSRKIALRKHNHLPAIRTYDNVRLKDSSFLTKLSEKVVVLGSDFVRQHGLFSPEGFWNSFGVDFGFEAMHSVP